MLHFLIVIAIVLLLLALRQNIILILAVAAVYLHVFVADSKIEFLIQDMWFAVDREVLLAIPLFILAGNVMSQGSIAKRLIDFMAAITSPIPGGLGIACVLSCAAFAAINGSSIVTMLAIGSIMYPALLSRGYDKSFALGAIASAGTLGIIIPPSIPLILYGIMTEKNIAHLFIAGIGPGLVLTALFASYSFWINRRLPRERFTLGEVGNAFLRGIFALLMPVIMIGGIYSGRFSPTESAAVALVYALIVDFLVHPVFDRILDALKAGQLPARAIGAGLKDTVVGAPRRGGEFLKVVLDTVKLLAVLLPLLCIAHSLNTILDYSGVPKAMVNVVGGAIEDRWLLMLGINVLLLIVGCLMDVGSAILVLAPLLQPLAAAKGFDPIHFGIIMIANLEIGYLTPPVGLNLIVAMAAFKESFGRICRAVVPFIVIMLFWLIFVVLYSPLSLTLVSK